MNIPHYHLHVTEAGFHFDLKENADTNLGYSESYKAKSGAKTGIESVRENSQLTKQYENRESQDGRFYFVIKAGNGQIIFTSRFCKKKLERRSLRALVKQAGKTPHIVNE